MRSSIVYLIYSAAILLAVFGCSSENDATAPEVGSIEISAEPSGIQAPWHLSGPSGFTLDGTGVDSIEDLRSGSYSIRWGDVTGYVLLGPSNETKSLRAGQTLTFSMAYTAALGSILIDTEPDEIGIPWQLTGPEGFDRAGTGDETLEGLSAGEYTIRWKDISGYSTPLVDTETQVLAHEGLIRFMSEYQPRYGRIIVDPRPENGDFSWHLDGPYGFSRSSSGFADLGNLVVGTYTISWATADGYKPPLPSSESQYLSEDATLTFASDYIRSVGSVYIDQDPDDINSLWRLDGPDGAREVGIGDAVIEDMPTGEYSLVWSDVEGFVTPITTTMYLAADDSIRFSGIFIEELLVAIDIGLYSWAAPGFSPLQIVDSSGGSVVVRDIIYTLFGDNVAARYRGECHDDLLDDFARVNGAGEMMGVRIEGLPVGNWIVESWHYDCDGWGGRVQILLRYANGNIEMLVPDFGFSMSPVEYEIVSDGVSSYEILYRPIESPEYRLRLNGIRMRRH